MPTSSNARSRARNRWPTIATPLGSPSMTAARNSCAIVVIASSLSARNRSIWSRTPRTATSSSSVRDAWTSRRAPGSQMRLTPTTAMTLAEASSRNSRRRRVPRRRPIAGSIGTGVLVDDALGALEEREWRLEPDRAGRDEVDGEHELVRDLDRDLGRRDAAEDPIHDARRLLAHPPVVGPVGDERAGRYLLVLVGHQGDLVLARSLDQQTDVRGHEPGGHVIDRVERALRQGGELAHDVVAARDVAAYQHQAQLFRGPLREAEADLGDALIGDTPEDAARGGRHLLQDLEPLAGQRSRVHGEPGEIVAGGRVVGHEPGADGIADPGEHDRDRRGRALGRHGVRRPDRHQHVWLR